MAIIKVRSTFLLIEMKYFTVFIVMCTISLLCSTASEASLNRIIKLLILMMELAAVYIYSRQENKDFILKVVGISTFITAAFIVVIGLKTIETTKRANAITGNSNQVSAYLAFGIMVLIYLLFTKKMKPLIPALGILTSVAAIVLQGSRTGIAVTGLMAVVEIIMLIRYENLPISKRLGLFLALILLFSAGVYYIISNPILYMTIGQRFMSLYEIQTTGVSSINETSVFNRMNAYEYAIERFLKNPLFGCGIDSFAAFSANSDLKGTSFCPNNYLELLQGIGIFGATAYYLAYFSILRKSFLAKKYKVDELSVLVLCILLSMLLMHITVVFYYQKLEYLYLGIMLAICIGFYEEEKDADEIS